MREINRKKERARDIYVKIDIWRLNQRKRERGKRERKRQIKKVKEKDKGCKKERDMLRKKKRELK